MRLLGEIQMENADYASASNTYARALSIDPSDCLLSIGLANSRSARGLNEEAAAALRAALAEDHACVLAHHGLARLLPHVGELSAALRHARAALELRPFDKAYEKTLEALKEIRIHRRSGDGAADDDDDDDDGGGGGGGGGGGEGDEGEGLTAEDAAFLAAERERARRSGGGCGSGGRAPASIDEVRERVRQRVSVATHSARVSASAHEASIDR